MLRKKLLRTMKLYRAQFISMIVMIAIGIGVFVGFQMEWYSIETDINEFFTDTGFSDYRIILQKGCRAEDAERIAAIGGVREVSRFFSVNTTAKKDGDVVALNVTENAKVSGFTVTSGAPYDPESRDGIWLSDRYAEANGISLGSEMTFTYKSLEITGRVLGLVKSGEYLICVPDATQLMPDYNNYGYAYLSPALQEEALGARFYTQINVLSDLDKTEFTERANAALGETLLIVSKEDTISYSEAMGESEEGKTMGSVLPVLFLAIAVLTMVTTMHRLAASEKTQIGTLKSLGFRDARILFHYSSYALMIGLVGTALGIGLGWALGWYIMNPDGAMGTYLDMPSWKLCVPPFVWGLLVAINAFLLLIGFLSVKSMLAGTAADALRPYTPKKMRSVWLERTRIWERFRFGTRWNLRDGIRHKTRSFMTLFGIVGCMVIVVAALGINDTIDRFVDLFYTGAIRYETKINLDPEHTSAAQAKELADLYRGDACAQTSVQLGDAAVGMEVYRISQGLVRFIGQNEEYVTLGSEGVYLCERIAKREGVKAGDFVTFSPFGSDQSYRAKVSGVLRSLTETVVMTEECADRLGFAYTINTVYTNEKNVPASDKIINTQSKQNIMDSFDTFMQVMVVMVWLLIIAAVILCIVVLYNLGVMSYTERYREMATLKVIGFKDGKIGRLLIGQNLWLTVIGVLLGIPAGIGALRYLITALASEYEMRLFLGWRTYTVSVLLTFGVSLFVGWLVSRKNRKIDMIEALKVGE